MKGAKGEVVDKAERTKGILLLGMKWKLCPFVVWLVGGGGKLCL